MVPALYGSSLPLRLDLVGQTYGALDYESILR